MFSFNRFYVIAVVAFQYFPAVASAQNIPQLDDLLNITHDATIGNYGFFGSTAAIQFGDGSRWSHATGVTGPKNASQGGRDLTVEDRFHIGSQTKTYTGTVVLKFVDAGVIGLTDTLEDWYQRAPYVMHALSVMPQDLREMVTVHDLLSMRSGLPEPLGGADPYTPDKTVLDVWNAKSGQYDLTVQQLLVASLGLGSTMTPGDENTFEYSNMNFMLAGLIAEAASCESGECKSIRELITELVITSEGLHNTIYPIGVEWGTDKHTNGSWNYYGAESDFTETFPSVPNAAGAMISNIDDQLTWLVEVTTNTHRTISAEMFEERLKHTREMNSMVGEERAGYGLAIYGQHSLGTGAFMIGHGGELSGYQTLMFQYPGEDNTDLDDLFVVANVNTFLNIHKSRSFGAADINNIYYDLQRTAVMYDTFEAAPDGCQSDASGIVCNGNTLAETTMPVFQTNLTIKPSGQRWVASQVTFDEAVPTWVFYGNDQIGVSVADSNVKVEYQGRLEGYGNGATLLDLSGTMNQIDIEGELTVIGKSSVVIDASSPSEDRIDVKIGGTVNGDIVATEGADQLFVEGTVNGDITLGRTARLIGAGNIYGMVSGAGTTIPGSSDETVQKSMTVTRYEANGGTLEIAVFGPEGSASSLLVDLQLSGGFDVPQTGLAIVEGGTLRLTGTQPVDDQMILLLHSDKGVSGTFATFENSLKTLGTTENDVTLDIVYTDKSVFLRSRLN
ncbi:MAG: CubicO group peptidase (beta-lactamase class C family) [Octadecabacter sp.]|jgi:CubicO group peptidase (beta-lactamase class C family)